MAKFTFINDDSEYEGDGNYPNAKTTVEFESIYLQAVVNQFEMFLKGSGFVFDSLEIVSDTSSYDPYDSEEDHGSNIPESHIEEVVTGVAKYPWEGTGVTKSFWNMQIPSLTTANFPGLTSYTISALSTDQLKSPSFYDYDRNK